MDIEQAKTLQPGQSVKVRDGRPRPPAHHKKKLRAWEHRNFDGIVEELQLSYSTPAVLVRVPSRDIAGCIRYSFAAPVSWLHVE